AQVLLGHAVRAPGLAGGCPVRGAPVRLLPQEGAAADLTGNAALRLQDREGTPDRGPGRPQVRRELPFRGQPGATAQAGPRGLVKDDLGEPVPVICRLRWDVPGRSPHPRPLLYSL